MSILKSKIERALQKRQAYERAQRQTSRVQNRVQTVQTSTIKPNLLETVAYKGSTSCKNVMKNYSRAFTTFTLSIFLEVELFHNFKCKSVCSIKQATTVSV